MSHIFAIGGGELSNFETYKIDRKIVSATGVKAPKALFIPTASHESQEYIRSFEKIYGDELGCTTDSLLLIEGNTPRKVARRKILNADLIYVGGGNTKLMMQYWKMYRVDEALKDAYMEGTILAGLSAGSICWFESGHSDSMSFESKGSWNYTRVKGINLIPAIHCPHYNEDNRVEAFKKMISSQDLLGIAIDNNCAIEFYNEVYKIHKSQRGVGCYKIYRKDGQVISEELNNTENYISIHRLFKKGEVING